MVWLELIFSVSVLGVYLGIFHVLLGKRRNAFSDALVLRASEAAVNIFRVIY